MRLVLTETDIQIVINLYWEPTASVRIMNDLSLEIRIDGLQRGVRQGCFEFPTIFNLYMALVKIFPDIIIINMGGVNVAGKNYNNLIADDTALLGGNEKVSISS